ncbi:MAG: undecaprenyl/decaprenyl-phosphate alpha-N-acetylglucosaminyl 1-phosphate transferase [Chloroflexi bacterium]|nr:MAG: undecaprenyl/decaprenyl-phosphate alpha-N-acetylglucosaminyl 1-phosphate transferase [Chloroflexota bacterium]
MTTYMLIFAAALAFAVGGTPVARWVAARTDTVDRPSGRKLHLEPIPLLGGAAIYVAFILALLLFGDRFYISQLVGILIGATLVSFLGIWDDRHSISPLLKLAGQALAAMALIATGVHVNLFPGTALDIVITLIWVIGITNALNLLDNMDGLSGGIAAIAAGFFLLMAALNGQFLVGSLAAALLGACVGFLRYNFNPAQIFMGDAGSLFLGFVLAAVGIKLRFPGNTYTVTWMIPVLVLGLPIFDTTLVFVSRLRRGVNPFTAAGKDHISHRLVARGRSQREAVMTLYLTACALGGIAMFVSQAGVRDAYIVGGAVALAGLYALWKFEWNQT